MGRKRKKIIEMKFINLIVALLAAVCVVDAAAHESELFCVKEQSAMEDAVNSFAYYEKSQSARMEAALKLQKGDVLATQIYSEGISVLWDLRDKMMANWNCMNAHMLESHPHYISLATLEKMTHKEIITELGRPSPLPCQLIRNKADEANKIFKYFMEHVESRYEAALIAGDWADVQVYEEYFRTVKTKVEVEFDFVNCERQNNLWIHGQFDLDYFDIEKFVEHGIASTVGEVRRFVNRDSDLSTLNEQEARKLLRDIIFVTNEVNEFILEKQMTLENGENGN